MYRLSVPRAILVATSFLFFVFTILLWFAVVGFMLAEFVSKLQVDSSQFGIFQGAITTAKSVTASRPFDFVSAYDLLGFVLTTAAVPFAFFLWRKAVNIPLDREPSQEQLTSQRKLLLKNVRNGINNILDQHPYHYAYVDLDKEISPESTKRSAPMPPAALSFLEIFDRSDGWMLILGTPGAGKTTTIYELASKLRTRAEQNNDEYLPVVFTLDSWDGTHKSLEQWLISKFKPTYDIKPEIGAYWLTHDKLIIMLDALDEVPDKARNSCVAAVNEFRSKHSTQVVISSRESEYHETDEKLDVGVAIRLKALNTEQIDKFVSQIGKDGKILKKLFEEQPQLKELAQTPFMLNVIARSASEIETNLNDTQYQQGYIEESVLDAYVRHMLWGADLNNLGATPSKTIHYLSYMTSKMKLAHSSVFVPELSSNLSSVHSWVNRVVVTGDKWWSRYIRITGLMLIAGLVLFVLPLAYTNRAQLAPSTTLVTINIIAIVILANTVFLLYYSLPRSIRSQFGAKELTSFERTVLRRRRYKYEMFGLLLESLCILGIFASRGFSFRSSWDIVWFVLFFYTAFTCLIVILLPLGVFRRLSLHFENSFPWNAKAFLENCVGLKFMYRIGPGYSFIHNILLEHFATLDPSRLHLEDLDAQYHAAKRSRRK